MKVLGPLQFAFFYNHVVELVKHIFLYYSVAQEVLGVLSAVFWLLGATSLKTSQKWRFLSVMTKERWEYNVIFHFYTIVQDSCICKLSTKGCFSSSSFHAHIIS